MKILLVFIFLTNCLFAAYDELFEQIGTHYNIPPLLLKKIAKIESDLNPNCINHNKNGTIDYGIMQINSCHFSELAKYGINESNIMSVKVNILAGAILVSKRVKNGYSFDEIGKYHSNTEVFKSIWNAKLAKELQN